MCGLPKRSVLKKRKFSRGPRRLNREGEAGRTSSRTKSRLFLEQFGNDNRKYQRRQDIPADGIPNRINGQ